MGSRCLAMYLHLRDIYPIKRERIKRIVDYAKEDVVVLMVHPEKDSEYSYVMGKEFSKILAITETRNYNAVYRRPQ